MYIPYNVSFLHHFSCDVDDDNNNSDYDDDGGSSDDDINDTDDDKYDYINDYDDNKWIMIIPINHFHYMYILYLQDLMSYCASDVAATHDIFTVIWPIYKNRFPHPVSFTGMLEMGSAYLPVNESWDGYIRDADNTFEDLEKEMKGILMKLANEACNYQHGQRYCLSSLS